MRVRARGINLIARGGRLFVAVSGVAAIAALVVDIYVSLGFAVLSAFFVFVFRDPKRLPGEGIVSPADGVVRETDNEKGIISIYLALRNVHVTRTPLAGTVKSSRRIHGRHRPAFSRKSPHNERLEIELETAIGRVIVVQMTGILARRIVPYVGEGSVLAKTDKLGLIRFGSRVDIQLPTDKVKITAVTRQRVKAGVTCVAEVLDERPE